MLGISPIYGVEYVLTVKLLKANLTGIQNNPVLTAGDFIVEFWDTGDTFAEGSAALSNLATLPVKLSTNGSTVLVKVSAAEMTHDVVVISGRCNGVGNTWADNSWVIYPDTRQTQLAHLDADVSTATAADLTTLEAAAVSIQTVTDNLPDSGNLSSIAQESTLNTIASYVDTEVAAIKAVTDAIPNAGTMTSIAQESTVSLLASASKLLKYVKVLARQDHANEVDNATEITEINADGGSGAGDFNPETDSVQAIRDHGDQSWLTGGGGGATDSYTENTDWTRTTGDDDGGAPSDTTTANGAYFSTGEVNSGNLIEVDTTFTFGAGEVALSLDVWGNYSGGGDHHIMVQAFDYSSGIYETVGVMANSSVANKYSFSLSPDNSDLVNHDCHIKFIHIGGVTGNATHALHIDKAQANTASSVDLLTAVDVRTEMDANSTKLVAILDDTETSIPATLSNISSYVDTEITAIQNAVTAVQNDLDNGADGLGALKSLIDVVNTKATAIKNFTSVNI